MDGIGLYPTPPARSPLSARAFGPELLLGELIGRGGMSRVYRGWVRGTGHEVAVKILRDDLASRPEAVQRFVRERDLLAAVASPHVVRVHDLVVDGDELGIVMDLVAGGHLRRAVTFPCPLATAAELTVQIADGLAAVHAAGVIHRDLKPENVLVDGDGRGGVCLRLTDFGISRLVDAALTQTTVTGTPGYLAPEVAAGVRPGAAADVYALGVVLYELSTGRAPFVADNPLVLILAHTRQEARRPIGMPDALWDLLAAMLAKDPAARPTAADVAARLRAVAPSLYGLPPCEPPEPEPLPAPGYTDPPPAPAIGPDGPVSYDTPGQSGYGYGTAPATVAGQGLRDGVQIMAPAGAGPGAPGGLASPYAAGPASGEGRYLTSELPARRDVHDPDGRRTTSRPGMPPWARVAAAAAGILLAALAAVGVRQALLADGGELVPTPDPGITLAAPTPVSSTPPPTQAPPDPAASTPDTVVVVTAQASPGVSSASASPTPRNGQTPSGSAAAVMPGAPSLSRSVPSASEAHASDGHVILTVAGLTSGTAAPTSLSVAYDGGQQVIPLGTPLATSYDTTVEGLENGRSYTFTAVACNAAGCTKSRPVKFTPYGAPEVPRPRATLNGSTVTVSWDAVDRHHNPGRTSCTVAVTGSPADSSLPDPQDASPDGGRITFSGKPGTTYVATLSCTTEDVADDAVSSSPLLVPAAATPASKTPASTSTTPTAPTSSSTAPRPGA